MTLLSTGGRDGLTTRAVAKAARVQPPVLYRLFNDKVGLLKAVAEYGFGVYMARKRPAVMTDDPVEFLRAGWRLHIEFGLTHPELYMLMYADPLSGIDCEAAGRANLMLREHMQRIAAAGRLRVTEVQAAHLFHAAACGVVVELLGMSVEQRDMSFSDLACDAALATIASDQSVSAIPDIAVAATTLRALVLEQARHPESNLFTQPERALLIQWLDRLAMTSSSSNNKSTSAKRSLRNE